MLVSIRSFLFGPSNLQELRQSSDERFEQLQKEIHDDHNWTQHIKETKEKTLEQVAREVDMESVFGLITDDRLFRMARTFEKWNLLEKHNIVFAAYVKAVASGRWQEFVDPDHGRPPSSILPQYKIKHYQLKRGKQYQARQERKTVSTATVILSLFVMLLIVVAVIFI